MTTETHYRLVAGPAFNHGAATSPKPDSSVSPAYFTPAATPPVAAGRDLFFSQTYSFQAPS